jgi:outer membrane lipoprotein SlyB
MADPADLSNLRDLALPPAVSLWPPAPGWWIIAAAGLAAAAILSAAALARYRRNAYRREALRQLDTVAFGAISAVLKRTALAAWPREQVAALTGAAWLAFLDRTGRTTAFTEGAGRHIETLAFGGAVDGQAADAARAAARAWVRAHRC